MRTSNYGATPQSCLSTLNLLSHAQWFTLLLKGNDPMNLWKKTILVAFWFVMATPPALAQLERVIAESRGIP